MQSVLKECAKSAVGSVNRPLARRRLARALSGSGAPYKIEVGAHIGTLPGWISTDVCWRTRHYLDAASPWPVPQGCASHVYSDNMIEHLSLDANRRFFRQAARALRPGGTIRLITPDVERLARLYLQGGAEARWHLDSMRSRGYAADHRVDLLRSIFQDCGHHRGYLWCLDSISTELTAAGFSAVRRQEAGHSEDPELRGLERRSERPESPIFLVVEAVRTT